MNDKATPPHVVKFFAEEREKRKRTNPPPPKRHKRPRLEASELNVWLALRNEAELFEGQLFKHDTFSGQTLLMNPVPVPSVIPPQHWKPCDVTDIHVAHLMVWLQANNFVKVSVSRTSHAIDMEAHRNAFSAAKQAFDALPDWDGEKRLDHFWVDACGATLGEPGMGEAEKKRRWQYLSATARCFFISIVARVYRPGCKADFTPILEGTQGTKKSSLLKVLAMQEDWFSDCMPRDLGNKDARSHLAGKLIVELAEMHQMKATQVDALKSFLTVSTDKFRPSYGRRDINQQRQCIFVGTTNASSYFRDETGNRRFWPIKCGDIDLKLAKQIVPQLYAEAKEAFFKGEHWWLPPEIEALAEEEQDERISDDPWEDGVKTVVDKERKMALGLGETFFWVSSVMGLEAIEGKRELWDFQKQYRVALILKKLGGKNKKLPRGAGWPKSGFRFITDQKGSN